MTAFLRTLSATTSAMLEIFDDASTLRYALAFETALAKAQAIEGLIDPNVAAAIEKNCSRIDLFPRELAEEASFAGTLAIPFVKRLRAGLDSEIAAALHKGATSQDLADSVLMCQAVEGHRLILADIRRISSALAVHAIRTAELPAVGRTLLQDALPVGFGLRIAHWQSAITQSGERLRNDVGRYANVQFGGAAGTRAGLDAKGRAIAEHIARALCLGASPPWHANRTGIAAIATSLGILMGALGKMARDIALLSQNAIAEAQEPLLPGRGGSSAMAHKRNPTGCQVALSAALRGPGLIAGILSGMPAEAERGMGGWQAEAPALTDLFLLAAGSADAMANVAEGLDINEAAITRNLLAADIGQDIGESPLIVGALLEKFGET